MRRFDLVTESRDLLAFLNEHYAVVRDQMTEAEAEWVNDRGSTAAMTIALQSDSQGSMPPVATTHHRAVAD